MTDVPRRAEPSGADKVATIADRAAVGSMAGVTQWHRPQAAKLPTSQNAFGSITVAQHGDDGTTERPNAVIVMWVGAATPANAEPYDFWYPVTL